MLVLVMEPWQGQGCGSGGVDFLVMGVDMRGTVVMVTGVDMTDAVAVGTGFDVRVVAVTGRSHQSDRC